jgi:hypothetical protein
VRDFLRKAVNQTLREFGYELRRKHDSEGFLGPIQFRTIIDGGANVGKYSADMRARYPNAEIFAFEPTPKLFKLIKNPSFMTLESPVTPRRSGSGTAPPPSTLHRTPSLPLCWNKPTMKPTSSPKRSRSK